MQSTTGDFIVETSVSLEAYPGLRHLLDSGNASINILSNAKPGGEVRGALEEVRELKMNYRKRTTWCKNRDFHLRVGWTAPCPGALNTGRYQCCLLGYRSADFIAGIERQIAIALNTARQTCSLPFCHLDDLARVIRSHFR
jgi:hypothetical protein